MTSQNWTHRTGPKEPVILALVLLLAFSRWKTAKKTIASMKPMIIVPRICLFLLPNRRRSSSLSMFLSSTDMSSHAGLLIIGQFSTISFRRLYAAPISVAAAARCHPCVEETVSSSDSFMTASAPSISHKQETSSPRNNAAGGEEVLIRWKTSPIYNSSLSQNDSSVFPFVSDPMGPPRTARRPPHISNTPIGLGGRVLTGSIRFWKKHMFLAASAQSFPEWCCCV